MTKMVYVAWYSKLGGDENAAEVSFDLEECRAAAVRYREHLTALERARSEHYIMGHMVPVLEGQSARVAYNDWLRELYCMPDPEYYEDVYVDSDYKVDVKMFKTNYHIWISRRHESVLSRLMTTATLSLTVAEAVEADVGVITDALAELDIKLPESIIDKVREEIEFIYRGKTI